MDAFLRQAVAHLFLRLCLAGYAVGEIRLELTCRDILYEGGGRDKNEVGVSHRAECEERMDVILGIVLLAGDVLEAEDLARTDVFQGAIAAAIFLADPAETGAD